MPRNPKRKTEIGMFSSEAISSAVEEVIAGKSLRSVAKQFSLSFQTLARYVKKKKNSNPGDIIRMTPTYRVNQIFTNEQEACLSSYLITCSKIFYGLPIIECRKLAYEMAVENKIKMPETWKTNKIAGIEWMRGFLKRHPDLSLRTPEGCSLSRATSFNKHNCNIFYDNLQISYSRIKEFADGTRIFNLDETSTLTVQKPPKVIAEKGIKQVSKVTSSEKGTLVTKSCIVSAAGNSLPPAMVFPRVHFKEHTVTGTPPGTLGLATPSGWTNSELFYKVMEHFIKYSHSSKDNPSLLNLDNHESHLSLAVLNLAKSNGVTMLTVPPHSTNKLQPLDVGVFKPFSVAYDSAVDSWMMQNPGNTFSMYNVVACVGYAHQKALTPCNIISAFKKCGIFPYDRNIFSELDFLPSSVTDRPLPTIENSVTSVPQSASPTSVLGPSSKFVDENMTADSIQPPGGSSNLATICTSLPLLRGDTAFLSPEQIRGYPKAGERKLNQKRPRLRGRSMIATDTPEKGLIEERYNTMMGKKTEPRGKKARKVLVLDEDCDVEEEGPSHTCDSPDYDSGEDIGPLVDPLTFGELERVPVVNDYVLIEFIRKSNALVYYIGKVLSYKHESGDFEISFFRKNMRGKFTTPNVLDVACVPDKDIKMILPKPTMVGITKRQQSSVAFHLDFSLIDIR